MRPCAKRKATILDAMVLVAAVACGLALRREMWGYYDFDPNWFGRMAEDVVQFDTALPYLMTFTVAVMIMRLRRPRPPWSEMVRQPGVAACLAAMGPVVIAGLRIAFLEWHSHGPGWYFSNDPHGPGSVIRQCGHDAGLWVLAAWLTLAVCGRRRPERSGIDRLGRVVGTGWLTILAIQILGCR